MCIVGRKRVPTQLKMHIFGKERLYFRGTANWLHNCVSEIDHESVSCVHKIWLHLSSPNVREDRLLFLQRKRDIFR